MEIFLLRHGEINNPNRILYSRLPGFHLTKEGRDHVFAVAELFKNSNIKEIYCSPLERTIETAKIIAKQIGLSEIHIHTDKCLIDTDAKKWTGKSEVEYLANPLNYKDIESSAEIANRAFPVIEKIANLKNNAIVVTHADVIMALVVKLTNDNSAIGTYADKFIAKGSFVKIIFNNSKWQICDQNQI